MSVAASSKANVKGAVHVRNYIIGGALLGLAAGLYAAMSGPRPAPAKPEAKVADCCRAVAAAAKKGEPARCPCAEPGGSSGTLPADTHAAR